MKRMFLSLLVMAAVSAGIGCGVVAEQVVMRNPKVEQILDRPMIDRSVNTTGAVEFIGEGENQITVLYVSGTPYEMGFEHGRLLREQVRATIRGVEKGSLKFLPRAMRDSNLLTAGQKRGVVDELMDRAWAKLRPFTPREDMEEMAGLAAGSGIPLETIHRMHAIPDLGETSCSALVAKDTATTDGHVYQMRILDYGANFNLQKRPLITVYRPTGANPFINIGWIGFVGVVSGMNQKGVALSEMGFGNPPGETLAGMPMPFLLKHVLRYADDAEQGAALVRAARRTNSYVYFIGDRHGTAIGMVTSAQRCQTYRANEQETLTVNNQTLPQFRDVIYAGHYEKKQAALVQEMQGAFNVPAIQELARQIAMKSNLHTVVYDLTAGTIWVANRLGTTRAADRPYVEFAVTEAWAKHLDAPRSELAQKSN